MYSLIIVLPLLGFLSGSLFGVLFGSGVCIITTTLLFITFLLSISFFLNHGIAGDIITIKLTNWISSESFNLDLTLYFDSLTAIMLIVVTTISTLVHLYSIEYMGSDPHQPRFMSYLSLFTFFMLLLITANNFLQMFIGWEGVGLASYLLINFWFTRIQANKAAIKAMLVNRVGDFFLLLGIFATYFTFQSLNYDVIYSLVPLILDCKISFGTVNFFAIDFICFCLFTGAMGKSAQIGLHSWLPDAMEGPTPVSALIHAATMVTAGVFLLARSSFFFEFSPFTLNFIILVGSITAFFAATTGIFQNDMKKVIAYSTCSQLGYMVFACGLSAYDVGVFHLSNHAFFKALLFLAAGSIIHAVNDEQDMRYLGGLQRLLPLSYSAVLIGSLALTGFPFLTGFFSKDFILEVAFSKYTSISHFAYSLGCLGAFCTSLYSTRLLYLVFLAKPNGNNKVILNAHEGTKEITIPLIILTILSIFIGNISYDVFVGFGTNYWGSAILILPHNYGATDIEFIPIFYKLVPFFLSISGSIVTIVIYEYYNKNFFYLKQNSNFLKIYTFFNKKWFFDRIYNQVLSQNILQVAYKYTYQIFDRGILEYFGPVGILKLLNSVFFNINKYQNGLTYSYLGITVILILAILFWVSNIITSFIMIIIILLTLINIF